MLTSEKNRRHNASPLLLPSLDAAIAHLEEQRNHIDALNPFLSTLDPQPSRRFMSRMAGLTRRVSVVAT